MRKMFSKNQIAVIAKNVVDSNEAVAWADSIKEYIEYDENLEAPYIAECYFLNAGSIGFTDSEDTLLNKLDEKQENPVDLTDIADTFAVNPAGNQLPDSSLENLTEEQATQIYNNILVWIKKGYIKNGTSITKIVSYGLEGIKCNFIAGYSRFDGEATLQESIFYKIEITEANDIYKYTFTYEEY